MPIFTVDRCFSETALEFASHPTDEKMAFAWLTQLREESVGWSKAKGQIVAYLKDRGAAEQHTTRQVEKAERFLRPWLLD